MKNAGDELKTLNALKPELDDMAAAAVGETIDTLGYESCVFTVIFGATAGAPTSIDYNADFYESDNSDMSGETLISSTAIGTDPTTGDTEEYDLDLRARKRYVRAKLDGTVVGGTTPTIGIAATVSLGQAKYKPAV
jgi:hypothetical protein